MTKDNPIKGGEVKPPPSAEEIANLMCDCDGPDECTCNLEERARAILARVRESLAHYGIDLGGDLFLRETPCHDDDERWECQQSHGACAWEEPR